MFCTRPGLPCLCSLSVQHGLTIPGLLASLSHTAPSRSTGSHDNPGVSCDSIRVAKPELQNGWFWIDPNEGCKSDSVQVFCNFTTQETCLLPTNATVGTRTVCARVCVFVCVCVRSVCVVFVCYLGFLPPPPLPFPPSYPPPPQHTHRCCPGAGSLLRAVTPFGTLTYSTRQALEGTSTSCMSAHCEVIDWWNIPFLCSHRMTLEVCK